MPKLTKKEKREWDLFIGKNGKRQYNPLCLKCTHKCKQSYRVKVIECRRYRTE